MLQLGQETLNLSVHNRWSCLAWHQQILLQQPTERRLKDPPRSHIYHRRCNRNFALEKSPKWLQSDTTLNVTYRLRTQKRFEEMHQRKRIWISGEKVRLSSVKARTLNLKCKFKLQGFSPCKLATTFDPYMRRELWRQRLLWLVAMHGWLRSFWRVFDLKLAAPYRSEMRYELSYDCGSPTLAPITDTAVIGLFTFWLFGLESVELTEKSIQRGKGKLVLKVLKKLALFFLYFIYLFIYLLRNLTRLRIFF